MKGVVCDGQKKRRKRVCSLKQRERYDRLKVIIIANS